MESLFELWGKRNPEWEKRYQSTIMDVFTDYGKGVNQYQDIRGKIFGAGYEIYIIAFFIGLYYNQTKPLIEDKAKKKVLGQAIMYWGNVENRLGRNSYGEIRKYIFAALIARTDVDLIALDKGEITARSVVDALITKMEQYANFGFDYIEEQLENDPNYFFKESAFLRVFTSFLSQGNDTEDEPNDEPDSLDEDEPDSLDDGEDGATGDAEELDAAEQIKLQEKQEKIEWSEDDTERLKLYFEHGMDLAKIAERFRCSMYSVKFQLSRLGLMEMPLDVAVENTETSCCLKNIAGEKVFEDEGKLKIISNKIYRFNYKTKCITMKSVYRSDSEWIKGKSLLVAYNDSELFDAITSFGLDAIDDFKIGESKEQNSIKVHGVWYDYYGDVITR